MLRFDGKKLLLLCPICGTLNDTEWAKVDARRKDLYDGCYGEIECHKCKRRIGIKTRIPIKQVIKEIHKPPKDRAWHSMREEPVESGKYLVYGKEHFVPDHIGERSYSYTYCFAIWDADRKRWFGMELNDMKMWHELPEMPGDRRGRLKKFAKEIEENDHH